MAFYPDIVTPRLFDDLWGGLAPLGLSSLKLNLLLLLIALSVYSAALYWLTLLTGESKARRRHSEAAVGLVVEMRSATEIIRGEMFWILASSVWWSALTWYWLWILAGKTLRLVNIAWRWVSRKRRDRGEVTGHAVAYGLINLASGVGTPVVCGLLIWARLVSWGHHWDAYWIIAGSIAGVFSALFGSPFLPFYLAAPGWLAMDAFARSDPIIADPVKNMPMTARPTSRGGKEPLRIDAEAGSSSRPPSRNASRRGSPVRGFEGDDFGALDPSVVIAMTPVKGANKKGRRNTQNMEKRLPAPPPPPKSSHTQVAWRFLFPSYSDTSEKAVLQRWVAFIIFSAWLGLCTYMTITSGIVKAHPDGTRLDENSNFNGDPVPLTMWTWNIGDRANEALSWDLRAPRLSLLIDDNGPDLVGLQDADWGQLDDLRRPLSGYAVTGFGAGDGVHGGEHTAYLYKTSKLKWVDGDTIWASHNPDRPTEHTPGEAWWDGSNFVDDIDSRSDEPHGITWARWEAVESSSLQFCTFNMHLTAHRDLFAVAGDVLFTRTRDYCDNLPVIWMGDFGSEAWENGFDCFFESAPANWNGCAPDNDRRRRRLERGLSQFTDSNDDSDWDTGPDDDLTSYITGPDMKDAFSAFNLDTHGINEPYVAPSYNGWSAEDEESAGEGPISHILVEDGDFEITNAQIIRVPHGPENATLVMSDNWPVAIDLSLV